MMEISIVTGVFRVSSSITPRQMEATHVRAVTRHALCLVSQDPTR